MSTVIPHWLDKQADLSPDETAVEWKDGTTVTFSQLAENSREKARKLAAADVTKGDHVAVLSGNSIEMIETIHACSYLGAVAVLLNMRLTAFERKQQMEDAEVTLLVAEAEEEALTEIKQLTFEKLNQLKASPHMQLLEEIELSDVFTMMYTSGTSGFPKAVQHTYENHWWSATSSSLNFGKHNDDKWLIPLPLFHVSGLSTMLKGIIYGMPIYLLEKFDVEDVHDAIMNKEVTIASVVTVMLQRLVSYLGESSYPESFRCMLLGGGPAPESLLQQTKAKQIPVFQSYGMTETASQIVTLSPRDALRKVGSAGKPLFPAQLKIRGQQANEVGEILVKGPMVTPGYYNRPEANEKSFLNGWLATGDVGYLDEEGFLYVVDRRSDLIISGGENIYPSEIENILLQIEGIREAGVTGLTDKEWGEIPVAFVVTDKMITKEEILSFLKDKLARYKHPKEIHFMDQLPRNAANKLVRQALKNYR
ncbi:2-succinylbenzoate--CoA ligase [Oceanobacillus oncorhynchi subsp. incaldanensis]|uniref:2-succinylbenzoate--CoA ligase n=1 Tax=Oceanobacillus aidingensis TaxID=645964 RepID=A0ABV9K097_9BACI|nr:o-succinylbenzoate--CoA ligase [Oceanobacillus oncorhynchi]MDM8098484.1 o-succinylbenzoate--CoA ligase [Oceanobacillus oncorhynchi]GIO21161.1 2-succinylbenzoate--CoA ligase [Oceanobacillus oncorhynchi subsp. incaldanensis]